MTNKPISSLISDLIDLYHHFPSTRKTQSLFFVGLILLAAFAEIFSIGIVIPFLGAIFQPDVIFFSDWAQPFLKILNVKSADALPLVMTIIFILVVAFASSIRVFHTWILVMLAHKIGADLSQKAFDNTVNLPYEELIQKNSNDLISTLFVKVNLVVIQIIAPCFSLITSVILTLWILSVLIFIKPMISISIFFSLACFYGMSILILKTKMLNQGSTINQEQNKVVGFLQEALGSLRDMILDNTQSAYSDLYKSSDSPLRSAQAKIEFYRLSPRHIIEAFVMIIFALIALFLISSGSNSAESSVAIMGALAMGGIKLLPLFQNGYAGWAGIKSHHSLLIDTLTLLNKPKASEKVFGKDPLQFNQNIVFESVSFTYQGSPNKSLNKISIDISKGSRVGIIGSTGSGKSTFVDVLMGLLTPTSGKILIDGMQISDKNLISWRNKISHVPQSIFLTNTTIAENIGLGIVKEKLDFNKIVEVAKGAKIHDVIESWPEGYNTVVGERGVKISGGELQRIGLARALYKDPEILILDEATSALDRSTENEVMQYIYDLKDTMTVFIISHRESTLDECSLKIELSNGNLK
jgi:ATP-binding cassette, subfamily B, bacterial PglK